MSFRKEIIKNLPLKTEKTIVRYLAESDSCVIREAMHAEGCEGLAGLPVSGPVSFIENNEVYTKVMFSDDMGAYGIYLGFDLIGCITLTDLCQKCGKIKMDCYMLPDYRQGEYLKDAADAFAKCVLECSEINTICNVKGDTLYSEN